MFDNGKEDLLEVRLGDTPCDDAMSALLRFELCENLGEFN